AIVLITILSESHGSYKAVPISASYPMAGIHAQIIDNILNNNFLNSCPRWAEFLMLIPLLLVFSQIARFRVPYGLLAMLILGLIYTIGYIISFNQNIILPITAIYLYLSLMAAMSLVSHYRVQSKQLALETAQRSAMEKELQEKISQLTELEIQLRQVQESELPAWQEKITALRAEIRRLRQYIKDTTVAEPKKAEVSQLHRIFPEIIFSDSSPLVRILLNVKKVAVSDSTVLLTGESGTGKELIARAIHRLSPRRNAPFVAINCAALTETLIESELFGHEKGAFTGAVQTRKGMFETADGGTIFLDEITETSLSFQVKLLRVVQEKEFYRLGSEKPFRTDVRIITATNRDIRAAVARREFREDLFYRLSVINIEIPPLRERKTDIPLLIQHFLKGQPKQFSQAALQILQQHRWPGNVRELQNLVQRCLILCETPVITAT
ncbi:MAG: sigma 54-interacting transcriptional regulator, partial [candidate division KSB1 bacterium]|nr:sigma 54-interacting transcriptional regulator [candidate division KSB1 bacterium]